MKQIVYITHICLHFCPFLLILLEIACNSITAQKTPIFAVGINFFIYYFKIIFELSCCKSYGCVCRCSWQKGFVKCVKWKRPLRISRWYLVDRDREHPALEGGGRGVDLNPHWYRKDTMNIKQTVAHTVPWNPAPIHIEVQWTFRISGIKSSMGITLCL